RTRAALPGIQATLPPDLQIKPVGERSVFVKGAVVGVVREAAIAAGLTGIMMLLFLGSWRSTVVVMTSIPLSLLVSIIVLNWFGQTINLMTLGGMALAVGILVDDATVEVENFHRQHAMGKPVLRAILDGAAEQAGRAGLGAAAGGVRPGVAARSAPSKGIRPRVRGGGRDLAVLDAPPRTRLLSRRRCRADPPSRARSCGVPDRGYATTLRCGG